MNVLLARLRDRARELGAVALRVADALPDAQTRERLDAAVARGDLASWPYDRAWAHAASDPASLLPGARAVVCLAFPYASDAAIPRGPRARVSNYAWSDDYHRRVQAALRDLAALIDAEAGAPATRVACDTAPLAERAFAQRAGLGWIGKHTQLIVKGAGPFVFLGEIVTTLALPADVPIRTSCGSCTRCVTACPTGALRGDYTIDATRCISDLTQRTTPIPRTMRPLIGMWLWGCDLCGEACPPAQRSTLRADVATPRSPELAFPDPIAVLHLRSGAFKRSFAHTGAGWRGAAVLRRNAAVVLGNRLDRAAIPALAGALERDPHPQVRGHAAWALGRIGAPSARAALQVASEREREPSVREEIAAALEPR